MANLKPFLSYENQIIHLKEKHGLTVIDDEKAIDVLSRVNYYRFSAYGISFRQPGNPDLYKPGTTFSMMYQLYAFDSLFRSTLLSMIEDIEIQFRSRVAYQLGKAYGPDGYLDQFNFINKINPRTGNSHYSETIRKFQNEVARQGNLPCVRHHNSKYGGVFPIWAAIELFTFGMVTSLYSQMKKKDQKAVASCFGTDAKHLLSWMLSLVEVRNLCAHSNRLYNMPLKQSPLLYSEHAAYKNTNRIFPVVLILKRLLYGQRTWEIFSPVLSGAFNLFEIVDLPCIGFPDNWRDVLDLHEPNVNN